MRIRLERIPDEGLQLEEPVTEAWLRAALGDDAFWRASGDGRLRVHLMRVDEVVHVRGRVDVTLAATCSRCLRPVDAHFTVPLEVAMFPRGKEPPAASSGELQGDDMGIALYDDKEVDLASIVHDGIYLELPMIPLCRDDCAGLCPVCGQDLNAGPCKCRPQIDERLSALKDIKLN